MLRGAAIVRPSTGTVPAAVIAGGGPQQIAQAQYAVRVAVFTALVTMVFSG